MAPQFPTRHTKFLLCLDRFDSDHPYFDVDVEATEEYGNAKPDIDELIRFAESAIAVLRTTRP